jgi:GNAT superfamily N-acetyltransferase
MHDLTLANGYYVLPPGKLANVVTCLEMTRKPSGEAKSLPEGFRLTPVDAADLDAYRAVFRKVGENWMWFSRLIMAPERLHGILTHPAIDSFILRQGENPVGLLELDFSHPPECELAFFGLSQDVIGQGVGRALMDAAIAKAWARPISRLWVHTCHFDHPAAQQFYRRSGFVPYQLMIEIHDDPRLAGHLPRSASPHVALLDPPADKAP